MADWSAHDHAHMARALRLAERGLFTTAPNPRVGCVLAHDGEVVGEGFHARAGEPHAEVFALREAGEFARGATAYVTLEPCAHFGRTPPCADALLQAGVARVVVAHEDPFPQVAGRGRARLAAAGVAVDTGLMRDAAWELNRGFFSRIDRRRPWLRVKLAMSLDGRIALDDGFSRWITGEPARKDVQRWRARSDALLTGSGTVRADDPRLTVRDPDLGEVRPPLRVVLDSGLTTAAGRQILDGSLPTLCLHAPHAQHRPHFERVERAPVAAAHGGLDLAAVMHLLADRQINEVQVEAGHMLSGALFREDLVDELLLYVAPVLLGHTAQPLLTLPPLSEMAQRWSLRVVDQRQIGADWRLLLRRA
jgi:diaminohydroxyphosphoribosylaminopyrimidine deaminase/5-amino-6-(5-phosphoribosylamino)uracil reductase